MPGVKYSCLYDVLFNGPQPDDMIAIRDFGRKLLTMGRLRQHVRETVGQLNAMGFMRNDRFVVVMPAGPELCVVICSIIPAFTLVPMNPYYSRGEFESYLGDLEAKALVVLAGSDSPAVAVARSLGIRIVEVIPQPDREAGLFSLACGCTDAVSQPSFAGPEDLAMIIFTSGTTARPKMIPFTQGRLGVQVTNYAGLMEQPYDPAVCNVNIQPMFHLHGVLFLFLSLACNISVACTPELSVQAYLRYLREYSPAWVSAGVAILQGLLDHGQSDPSFSLPKTVRQVAPGGSHLPPELAAAFEARFGFPLVNTYGLTESQIIASNSVEKARVKPGSVGTPVITQVKFVDESGRFLGPGKPGEIVVRGPMVITGYLNNPEENARAFVDGWLRTGDTGYLDADGYLFVTGRVRELINKGGEKVSPGEVEDVLRAHQAVSGAVVFSVPDPVLGENVGAAVVLKRGITVRPVDLKRFVSGKLAYFKVPAGLWIVDSIPVEPTGKVRRIGMYQKLKDAGVLVDVPLSDDYEPPATPEEAALAALWAEVLGVERVGRNESFFDLGGDSIKVAALIALIEKQLDITLPMRTMINAPTVSLMARAMSDDQACPGSGNIVALQPEGTRLPLYCFPTLHGTLFEYYALARDLSPDLPVYGFLSPGIDGRGKMPDTIEALARLYIKEIRDRQPHGPYHLSGFCAGSVTAYEVACQLEAEGEVVGFLGLVDFPAPGEDLTSALWSGYRFVMDNVGGTALHLRNFKRSDARDRFRLLALAPRFLVKKALRTPGEVIHDPALGAYPDDACRYPDWVESLPEPRRTVGRLHFDALSTYVMKPYGGNVTVFMSSDRVKSGKRSGRYQATFGWRRLAKGRVRQYVLDGDHVSILGPECTKAVARIIRKETSV